MALMREQIDMAQQAKVESADQMRHLVEKTSDAAVNIAGAVAGGRPTVTVASAAPGGAPAEVECTNPECRKMVAIGARFCRHCSQQLRV